jgi:hypothetical protein
LLLTLAACGRIGFGLEGSSTDAAAGSSSSDAPLSGDASSDGTMAAWHLVATPPTTSADLWGVYAFSATDEWVAGTTGTIQHFTGTWTTTASGTTNTMFMFWGSAPSNLYLVGRSCTAVLWNGSAWAPTSIPGCTGNQDLMSITGTATSNVWVSGTMGNVEQFTSSWQNRSQGNPDYWDTYTASATDAYAIGTLGTIQHWNGTTMTADTSGTTQTLAAITSPAAGEYWIVGAAGVTLHKVGAGSWTLVQAPTATFLYDVIATSPTDLWAVGSGGLILHGDGSSWTQVTSPTTNTLRSIAKVPGGGLLAVGTAGTMIAYP